MTQIRTDTRSRTGGPVADDSVRLNRLTLTDFRCHAHLRVEAGKDAIALVGGNGAGKTSVLEAISLLAPGRGLRRARLSDIGRWQGQARQSAAWAMAARLAGVHGIVDVGTGIEPGGGDRRVVKIDGQPARSQAVLSTLVGILWLTPDMDRLFTDSPSARRRFFDRIVFGLEPEHASRVGAYERAMRERARLLAGDRADDGWVKALEWTMATEGITVAASRHAMARRLDEAALRSGDETFPRAVLSVEGPVDTWLAENGPGRAVERFACGLAKARAVDAVSGVTTLGPHRSEIVVRQVANGRAARECSTGEQKALLIAIVLSAAGVTAAARGSPPILLLDEVAAHLDERRRRQLFATVKALGGQVWYAGTDAATFAPLGSDIEIFPIEHHDQ